jgi:hypothetical protein
MFEIDNYRIIMKRNSDSIYLEIYDMIKFNFIKYIKTINDISEFPHLSSLDQLYDRLNKMFGQNTTSFKGNSVDFNIKIKLLNEQLILNFDIYYKKMNSFNEKINIIINRE